MKSDFIAVTDHIEDFSIEREILGKFFEEKISEKTSIILVWHKDINENFLRNYPSIRAIVRYGVGYDNIDLTFCKKNNIVVANTPDYGVDEVAEYFGVSKRTAVDYCKVLTPEQITVIKSSNGQGGRKPIK